MVTRTSKGRILRHYGMTASTTNVLSVLVWRHQPRGTTPRTAQKSQIAPLRNTNAGKKGSARCRPAVAACPQARTPSAGSSRKGASGGKTSSSAGQRRCSRTMLQDNDGFLPPPDRKPWGGVLSVMVSLKRAVTHCKQGVGPRYFPCLQKRPNPSKVGPALQSVG